MIDKIREAVYDLLRQNCNRRDIVIAMNPLAERLLIEEAREMFSIQLDSGSAKTLEGVEIYNKHPYNEIVIYDSKNAYYHEQKLIRVIKFGVEYKSK